MTRFAVALSLAASACAGGVYASYRAAHPAWNGAFPSEGADVQQTLASLYAPAHGYERTVTQLLVWRIDGSSWTPVDPASLLRLTEPPAGDFAVAAALECLFNDGQARFVRGANVWYLLPADRLAAYDHYDFAPGCELTNAFVPARGAAAESEHALVARSSGCDPVCAMSAGEAYEKGRALVRAGRMADANAMLEKGDRTGDPTFDLKPRVSGPRAREQGPSPVESRAALVRELAARQ